MTDMRDCDPCDPFTDRGPAHTCVMPLSNMRSGLCPPASASFGGRLALMVLVDIC